MWAGSSARIRMGCIRRLMGSGGAHPCGPDVGHEDSAAVDGLHAEGAETHSAVVPVLRTGITWIAGGSAPCAHVFLTPGEK